MEKPYFSIRRRAFSLVREIFSVLDEHGARVAVLRLKRSYGGIFLLNRLAVLMLIGVFAGLLIMHRTEWGEAQSGLVRAAVILLLGAAGGALYVLLRITEQVQYAADPRTGEKLFTLGENQEGALHVLSADLRPIGRIRWADEEESKLVVEVGTGGVACVLSPPPHSAAGGVQTKNPLVEIRDAQEAILGDVVYGRGRRRFDIRMPAETRGRLDERLLWLAAVRGRFMAGKSFPLGLAP
ncbi:MAG: hypothetical protein JSV08_07665 [Acidobacteriota bacterium]|nr:MAG: hypothetical protein JSV08_07665 [Acidobacteriota bacterium]